MVTLGTSTRILSLLVTWCSSKQGTS